MTVSVGYIVGGVSFLAFGSYVVISVVLFKFPHLMHKKKQPKFRAVHISHRGGAADRLENTMEAFKNAVAAGTDMLELDCHLSLDQQVVVAHDDAFTRTCGCEGRITQTNYKDLPPLMKEVTVDFFPSMKGTGADRRMPLLEEVFEAFPHIPINVDIKDDDDMLIEKVDALIRKYDREEITVWGNVKDRVCQKLYKVNPRVPLLFSGLRVLHLVLLFWTGLLPFVSIKESFLEVLAPVLVLDSERLFQRRFGCFIRGLVWAGDKLLIRPALIRHLERRGIQTFLWVLNTDHDFEVAFKTGAAGVMTDRPELLRAWLDRSKASGVRSGDCLLVGMSSPELTVTGTTSPGPLDGGEDSSALIR
ncbi:hypothetical protein EGW08_006363 [Elysia chlorotica]|uniref:GP-PDE domain-containing protein n=1 Tax=Elysia chlorotica TaxID=188477 RepID=A0A3S1BDJ6_ELYCH|nr:hypothetical protein EGW08_006363 [Elysia chlorotica]